MIYASERCFGVYFEWNYSLLERRFDNELADKFRARGQIFIGRSPLFRGLITESFYENGVNTKFLDVRNQLPKDILAWCHGEITKIISITRSFDLSISEFAIAHCHANSDLDFTIPGVSKHEHSDSIEKVLKLSSRTLDLINDVDLPLSLYFPKF